jgi:hypothetical protein
MIPRMTTPMASDICCALYGLSKGGTWMNWIKEKIITVYVNVMKFKITFYNRFQMTILQPGKVSFA